MMDLARFLIGIESMEQQTDSQPSPHGGPLSALSVPGGFAALAAHVHLEEIGSREKTTFWRVPGLSNLELLRATFITHAFSLQTHEAYAIVVVETGADQIMYPRLIHIAPQDSIVLINPRPMLK